MKVIDLLVKIAKGEEVPKKIKYCDIEFEYSKENMFYYNDDFSMYRTMFSEGNCLNDEVEIIEEEKTYEQNFTGWQIVQNGKVVASYNAQRLKPVDITDVEKDIKEMLEEKPKKIEEVVSIELLGQCDNWLQHSGTEEKSCMELNPYILETITRNFRLLYHKQCELTKAVNYLLEKESDK